MHLYVDGYTIGANPSKVGGGYVVMDERKNVLWEGKCLKPNFTNNEAELIAIMRATELAHQNDTIFTDSHCAWCWVIGGHCKARRDLNKYAAQSQCNMYDKNLTIKQIPREINLAGIYLEDKKYGTIIPR